MSDNRKFYAPLDSQEERWLLVFDDPDKPWATFTGKETAIRAFKRAEEGGWNCYLFELSAQSSRERELVEAAFAFLDNHSKENSNKLQAALEPYRGMYE